MSGAGGGPTRGFHGLGPAGSFQGRPAAPVLALVAAAVVVLSPWAPIALAQAMRAGATPSPSALPTLTVGGGPRPGHSAGRRIVVAQPPSVVLSPTNGSTVSSPTLVASGLTPNTEYRLCYDSVPGTESSACDTFMPGDAGSYNDGVSVPPIPEGTYTPEVWFGFPSGTLVATAPSTFTAVPTMSFPSDAVPGTSLPFTAHDLHPGTSYTLCFDAAHATEGSACLAFGPTDANGTYEGSVILPSIPSGPYYVDVWTAPTAGTWVTSAPLPFTVDPAPPTLSAALAPLSGPPGANPTLAVYGLSASTPYFACYDPTPKTQSGACDGFFTSSNGSYYDGAGVPAVPTGSYSVEIWTADPAGTFVVASANEFAVTPRLGFPGTIVVGSNDSLNAAGLAGNASYWICFDRSPGIQSANCTRAGTSDGTGSISDGVVVPSLTPGPYYAELWTAATSGTFVVSLTSPITIEPTISGVSLQFSPTRLPATGTGEFTAYGLTANTEFWLCFDAVAGVQGAACDTFTTGPSGAASGNVGVPSLAGGTYVPEAWTAATSGTRAAASPSTVTVFPTIAFPGDGNAGTNVTFSADGLAGSTSYALCLDAAPRVESAACTAVGPTNGSGVLSSTFPQPALAVGPYYAELWTSVSGGTFVVASGQPFTVEPSIPTTALAVDPWTGNSATSTNVAATGLTPNTNYWLCWDATPGVESGACSEYTAAGPGTFDGYVGVPDLPNGTYAVELWNAYPGGALVATAGAAFSVVPEVSFGANGTVGSGVRFSGVGLPASANLDLCLDPNYAVESGHCIAFGPTAPDGSFSATFTVPSVPAGVYFADVWTTAPGGTLLASSGQPFAVVPGISTSLVVDPTEGTVGPFQSVPFATYGLALNTEYWLCFDPTAGTQGDYCNSFSSNGTGAATTSINLPSMPSGSYDPEIWTGSPTIGYPVSQLVVAAADRFTVVPDLALEASGTVGSGASLSGQGLPANASLSLCFDLTPGVEGSTCVAAGTVSSDGSLSATVTIPTLSLGPYAVELWTAPHAGVRVVSSLTPFTVEPQISQLTFDVGPAAATVGPFQTINVTAYGLAYETEYWVCFDAIAGTQGGTCGYLTTNSSGGFDSNFAMPGLPAGTYTPELWNNSTNGALVATSPQTLEVLPSFGFGSTGTVGSSVGLGLEGVDASTNYSVCFDATAGSQGSACETAGPTASDGSLSASVTIPALSAGPYFVELWTAPTGGALVTAFPGTFTVEPILAQLALAVAPASGTVGPFQVVNVAAYGLGLGVEYWLCFDLPAGTQSGFCSYFTANSTGGFDTNLQVPGLPAGVYTPELWSSEANGTLVATAPGTFTVDPTLSLPSGGAAGSATSFQAEGLAAGEDVSLCFDSVAGTESGTCVAVGAGGGDGSLAGTVTVPSLTPGPYYVELWTAPTGGTLVVADDQPFAIVPAIVTAELAISPTAGTVGPFTSTYLVAFGLGDGALVWLCFDPTAGTQGAGCDELSANATGAVVGYIDLPDLPTGEYTPEIWTAASGGTLVAAARATFDVIPGFSYATAGLAGSGATFSATGLAASATFALCFDATAGVEGTGCVALGPTDANGSFSATVTVPAVTPGPYFLELWTAASGGTWLAEGSPFLVAPPTALALTSTGGPVGEVVTVTGSSFAPDSPITFTFGGVNAQFVACSFGTLAAGVVTTDGAGSFVCTVKVPAGATSSGVVAVDGASDSATLTFQITVPSIAVAPTNAAPGSTLTLSGSGFASTDTSLTISSRPAGAIGAASCPASNQTIGSCSLTLAPSVSGTVTITATGAGGPNDTASTSLTIVVPPTHHASTGFLGLPGDVGYIVVGGTAVAVTAVVIGILAGAHSTAPLGAGGIAGGEAARRGRKRRLRRRSTPPSGEPETPGAPSDGPRGAPPAAPTSVAGSTPAPTPPSATRGGVTPTASGVVPAAAPVCGACGAPYEAGERFCTACGRPREGGGPSGPA